MTVKRTYQCAVIGKIFPGRRATVFAAGHILWSRLGCFVVALRGGRVMDEPRWELSGTLSIGLSLRLLRVCQRSFHLRVVGFTLCQTFNDHALKMMRICISNQPPLLSLLFSADALLAGSFHVYESYGHVIGSQILPTFKLLVTNYSQ